MNIQGSVHITIPDSPTGLTPKKTMTKDPIRLTFPLSGIITILKLDAFTFIVLEITIIASTASTMLVYKVRLITKAFKHPVETYTLRWLITSTMTMFVPITETNHYFFRGAIGLTKFRHEFGFTSLGVTVGM